MKEPLLGMAVVVAFVFIAAYVALFVLRVMESYWQ